jgi:hypothetical protein
MNRNVQWNFVHTVNCCKLYQIKNFAFLQGENQLGVKHVTQIPEKERKKLRIGSVPVGMVFTA